MQLNKSKPIINFKPLYWFFLSFTILGILPFVKRANVIVIAILAISAIFQHPQLLKNTYSKIVNYNKFFIILLAYACLMLFNCFDIKYALLSYFKISILVVIGSLILNLWRSCPSIYAVSIRGINYSACFIALILFVDAALWHFFKIHNVQFYHCKIHVGVALGFFSVIKFSNLTAINNNIFKMTFWLLFGILCANISDSDGAILGVIVSFIMFLISLKSINFASRIITYALPMLTLISPIIINALPANLFVQLFGNIDFSYAHRWLIYKTSAYQIMDNFWFGGGFGFSRFRKLIYLAKGIPVFTNGYWQLAADTTTAHHPHNFALQLWLESGFIGVMIVSLLWIKMCRKLNFTPTLIAIISYMIGYLAVGISIWENWWWAQGGLFLALVLAKNTNDQHVSS